MQLKNIHKLFLVFQATTLVTIAGIERSTVDCSTCVGTCVYEPSSESTICYKKLGQVSLQVGAAAPAPVAPQESQGDRGATFTLVNNCSSTIWPAIQGNPDLGTTRFELPKGGSRAIHAPPRWTGRLWGRTGCTFNGSANGSCTTGDTVATLAEFGLGSGSVDIYDVSLVDGFNLPLRVDAVNGSGQCASVGCVEDLIQKCPEELRSEGGGGCRSACVAFNTTVHCCRGSTCKPTLYSQLFKNACPLAYSYATDDANSTFTCTAADYVITFCASSMSLSKNSSKSEDGRGGLIAGIVLVVTGIVLVPILVILCCCKCCCKRRRSPGGPNQVSNQDIEKLLLQHGSLALKRFKYSKIKKITKSFSDKLGQGGYGSVYKGELPDGCLVAVKVLIESDSNGEEFINEVASISRTSHVNIVNLLGFCFDKDKRALVYQYMPNKSLDKFISNSGSQDSGSPLDMKTLYNIAVGVAKGLEYLHNGCNTRIVHFDIKPQNILLDEDLCPKISDFGLAKLCKKKQSALSMLGTRGTIGYIAPEVFSRNFGVASHKSDVYSYGMMVLEMAGARNTVEVEPIQSSENYFPDKIYEQVILDFTKKLDDFTFEEEEIAVKKMLLVGFWCIQTIPSDRPSISKVVEMLEGSLRSIQIPPHPVLVTPNLPAQDVSLSFSTYARSEKSDEV